MPVQRIENVSGTTAIWGSFLSAGGTLLGWINENTALCGLIIALGGLIIQSITSAQNRKLRNTEEQRKIEEHRLKMLIMQAEAEKAGISVLPE